MYPKGTSCLTVTLWLAVLFRDVKSQDCPKPSDISGTRHNGSQSADTYPVGTILEYYCDTGYKPNYNSRHVRCVRSTGWNPPDFKCELDVVSLVVAVVVALVGIIVFVFAVAWLVKRRNETDSRRIKRKQREASHKLYQQRGSSRENGYVNGGLDIEMSAIGMPMGANENEYASTNGLLWSPPAAQGSVQQDYDVAVLQRSRKSSKGSKSSVSRKATAKKNEVPPTGVAGGIQLNPDYGDVEFGASAKNTQNFRDIGSTVKAMAPPTMSSNKKMEMSLPMPDDTSPTMTSPPSKSPTSNGVGPTSPSNMDFNNLYAAVDYSKKRSTKKGVAGPQMNGRQSEKKQINNNNSINDIPDQDHDHGNGYAAILTAHEEALEAESGGYSDIRFRGEGAPDAEGDYAEVQRAEEEHGDKLATPLGEEKDFDGLYAKVKK